MRTMVAAPIATLPPCNWPGWITVLMARTTRLAPSALYPVKLEN